MPIAGTVRSSAKRGFVDSAACLAPHKSESVARVVGILSRAAGQMESQARGVWHDRLVDVYGDLSGQRALDREMLARLLGRPVHECDLEGFIIGLQTYFVIVADVLAVSCLQPDYVSTLSTFDDSSLLAELESLSNGRRLESLGVLGARGAFPFDWYVAHLDRRQLVTICKVLARVSVLAERVQEMADGSDVMNAFYRQVMPKNLLHIMGEFYTPLWLAELLLSDTQWSPNGDMRLIDPFAGSGIFLLAALRRARVAGVSPVSLLSKMLAIDLNPVACAAARTNMIIYLAGEIRDCNRPVHLPVLCADTIFPSVLLQSKHQEMPGERDTMSLIVDGRAVDVPARLAVDISLPHALTVALADWGIDLRNWLRVDGDLSGASKCRSRLADFCAGSRRVLEQLAVMYLKPADVLVTNPPWVGWEYMSRPYRDRLKPGWTTYSLFTAKGREAAFLKEDLSTLALVTAWDRYLGHNGTSAIVLRPASMQSHLAAKGLRRLSLFPRREPLSLNVIRDFPGIRPFQGTQIAGAAWALTKGTPTRFPVKVIRWRQQAEGWQPSPNDDLQSVGQAINETQLVARRSNEADLGSAWTIGDSDCQQATQHLLGSNEYQVRMGVFTGGANAVYYVEPEEAAESVRTAWYRNVTARAKRKVSQVRCELEESLVYEIVRGRDINEWQSAAGAHLLCPHTRETRMKAIPREEMRQSFPKALEYLDSMRHILDDRRGFSGWEKHIREDAYYAIQRIGQYTFMPYKTAWRYVASDFIVAVVGPRSDGRPRLCNDKVMYIAFEAAEPAYFLCGLLSSAPIRWSVVSTMTGTQISTNAIRHLRLPQFDNSLPAHRTIAEHCRLGHDLVKSGKADDAKRQLAQINEIVARMYGLSPVQLQTIHEDLGRRNRRAASFTG